MTTKAAPIVSVGMTGRVALVTGGTSGIGLATAAALLDVGAVVPITGRDAQKGEAALEQLHRHRDGSDVMFHPADVTREDDVAQLVEAVVDRFGGLHVAVNNAAIRHPPTTPALPSPT